MLEDMGKLLKAYDVTLSLRIELHDIEEGDIDTSKWSGEMSPTERETALQSEIKLSRAILKALLKRSDYNETVLPAIIADLAETKLQDAINGALDVESHGIYYHAAETISTMSGEEGQILQDLRNQGTLNEIKPPYTFVHTLSLNSVDIQEQ